MRRQKLPDVSSLLARTARRQYGNRVACELPQAAASHKWVGKAVRYRERRFAAKHEQVSDLVVQAAKPILERFSGQNVEFLIFASACADLIEPATCNIVQHKLGLQCPALDVKNACNSFVSGLMTASSLIAAGICNNVLVVTGEKPSDAIRFDFENDAQMGPYLAGFTFGDAGAAALVTVSPDDSGFSFSTPDDKGRAGRFALLKAAARFPHTSKPVLLKAKWWN